MINDFADPHTTQVWKKRKTLFLIIEGAYPKLNLSLIYSKLSNLQVQKNQVNKYCVVCGNEGNCYSLIEFFTDAKVIYLTKKE